MTQAMNDSVPKHIGEYRVDHIIGEGAMGIVYLARDRSHRKVAIKCLKHYEATDSFREHFNREMLIYQNLIHPNLVIPFEVKSHPNPYIVMEYVEGKALSKAISTGIRFELGATARILEQIGDGLSYVHQLGVSHGDLNPQNIILTRDQKGQMLVKILDFGIAKTEATYVPFGQTPRRPPKAVIREGAYGTPGYIAPELFTKQKLDFRADIFSFGVIAHELITGHSPYPASVPWRTLNKPAISAVTEHFQQIMSKALNENPMARFDSAIALAEALSHLFEDHAFHEMLVDMTASHSADHHLRPEYNTQDILKWEFESEGFLNG